MELIIFILVILWAIDSPADPSYKWVEDAMKKTKDSSP